MCRLEATGPTAHDRPTEVRHDALPHSDPPRHRRRVLLGRRATVRVRRDLWCIIAPLCIWPVGEKEDTMQPLQEHPTVEDMRLPLPAPFDPTHPAHRTVSAWAVAGNQSWFVNLVTYTLAHGEARVLLRCGGVLKLTFHGVGPIDVEEL